MRWNDVAVAAGVTAVTVTLHVIGRRRDRRRPLYRLHELTDLSRLDIDPDVDALIERSRSGYRGAR